MTKRPGSTVGCDNDLDRADILNGPEATDDDPGAPQHEFDALQTESEAMGRDLSDDETTVALTRVFHTRLERITS